jgi:BNR/Asp-box repeat
MGERLAIDPNLTSTLYFGSRTTGLWTSPDFAKTWTQVKGFPTTGVTNNDGGTGGYGLTFVVFDPHSGTPGSPTPAIYVGVGVTSGTALYRSTDAGATWQAVAGQPAGMMPHHAVLDGCGNIYLAYNNGSGPNSITSGAVWVFNTASGTWANVSPPNPQNLTGGFGGIAADAAHPGTLIVTTIDRWTHDEIYRTTNGGANWAPLESAAQIDVTGAPWVLWHKASVGTPGWMGDVEIDPFNPARALYITGGGIWSSDDITAADTSAPTHWTFEDDGLEETVVQDLISPPAGAPLLSAVGDIGGFRHDDLDVSPPGGFFANPAFTTTSNLDFAQAAPNIVVRVGSGGLGGAYSTDGGTTWAPFANAPAAPTGTTFRGSGSIAVSADGTTFLWAPQGQGGPGVTPAYSQNNGTTWTPCAGLAAGVRVAADRVNPLKFYASGRNASGQSLMYVSTDGGANFVPVAGSPSGRPRPVFGIEGDVWVPTGAGLYHSQDSATTFVQVPQANAVQDGGQVQQVNSAAAVGFGMPAPGQSYPAVYLAGSVDGVWGTYRSDDVGATWLRIDDPQHQFGWINCVTGDPRIYGRVYLGTGGRGILYGDQR